MPSSKSVRLQSFTTHTPVPAGHDIFTFQLMDKYFGSYLPGLDLAREEFFKLGLDPKNPKRLQHDSLCPSFLCLS